MTDFAVPKSEALRPSVEAPKEASLLSTELQAIYRAEFHYVFHTLRRLGVRDKELEDVTHDVMLTVHRRLPDYDRSRPLRPWLFGIAYRIATDHKRLARHSREVTGPSMEPADTRRIPDEQLEEEQTRRLVLQALEVIELDRRAILIMHDLDGHRMPEISDELGIPLNTAYSRLRQARKEFEQAIRRIDPTMGQEP